MAPTLRGGSTLLHRTPVSSKRSLLTPAPQNRSFNPALHAAAKDLDLTGSELIPVASATAVSCLGALLFGYHLGVLNGPLGTLCADLGVTDPITQGFVVSIALAGAAVGSLAGSGLADSMGRRTSFLLDVMPLAAGTLLCAAATSIEAMMAGRFIIGIGIGLSSALVPLYISEVAPTKLRGTLGALNQLSICVGILVALLVNVALPPTAWRSMFTLAAVPAGLLGLGMVFSPESPRWLASKGRGHEANDAATRLWGPSGPQELEPDTGPNPELESSVDVEVAVDKAMTGVETLQEDAKNDSLGDNKKVVAIGCVLFLIQQFSGINAIVYFSSDVFANAGVASATAASAAVGAVNVIGAVAAASLMEKAGRKSLLSLSLAGQAFAMCLLAAGFSLPALQPYAGTIALGGTLLYVASFAIGCGPVPGLIVPEIVPANIRGTAVSMAMGVHWVSNFAIGQLFLASVAQFSISSVYLFFACVCGGGFLFVQRYIVETKGRSFKEIADLMDAV